MAMTAYDRPADHPQELELTEAAVALGISREALRSRIRRRLVEARQVNGRWLVRLPQPPGQPDHPDHGQDQGNEPVMTAPDQGDDRSHNQAQDLAPGDLVAELRTRITGLEADKLQLQLALERSQQGEAELRRLLGNAQQQLQEQGRAMLAAPMPPTHSESPEIVPVSVEAVQTSPANVKRALKREGLGKKARRRLLEVLGLA